MALLVGINDYQNGVPPLRNAVADVQGLAPVLREIYGYEVTCLCDTGATLATLRAELDTLSQTLQASDRLLLYFAGHGIAEELGDPGDGPQGYLLLQDAQRDEVNTFLPMLELQRRLQGLRPRHLLLFLDCCFAGAFRWSTTRSLAPRRVPVYRERFERYLREPAWQVITSAAYDERALDVVAGRVLGSRGEEACNSPFAAALIRGLQGEADLEIAGQRADGVIIAQELFLFLEDAFSKLAQRLERSLQRPMLWSVGGRDKGQFVFLRPGHEVVLPSAQEMSEAHNPYRGLQIYTAAEKNLFFGREAAIVALSERVGRQSLIVVSGASGTGKSSLVRAGLLPRLADRGGFAIQPTQRPGAQPLMALSQLARELAPGESELPAAVSAWLASHPGERLLLVIDQLEELVTLGGAQRDEFLRQVQAVRQAGAGRVHWVLTLRSDYEPHFSELLAGGQEESPRYVVPPLSRDELREIIEGPAAERALFFEPASLVDQLLDEVADLPGALPLLSFLLSEMYRASIRRPRDRTLSEADYKSLGGVSGALSQRADRLYESYATPEEKEAFRYLMLRMVAPGEVARQRVLDSELLFPDKTTEAQVATIRDHLIRERLLLSDRDPQGRTFYEPVHDKLVLGWPQLSQFLMADRAHRIQQELREAAGRWQDSGRSRSRLWLSDPLLPQALYEARRAPRRFNRIESEFLQASQRLQRGAYGLLGVGLLLALALFGIIAVQQRQRASEMHENLQSTRVELGRRELLAGHPAEAMEALQQGLQDGSPDPSLRYLMADAGRFLQIDQPTFAAKPTGGLRMGSDSFSPDGRLLVVPSAGQLASVYDTATGRLVHELIGQSEEIVSARFSSDGRQILTCGEGPSAVLWDAANGRPLRSLQGHTGVVLACAFSADGTRVATGGSDQTLRIWDTASGRLLTTISRSKPVAAVQFSPQGDAVLSRAQSGSARLADVQTGKEISDLVKARCTAIHAEFSPDGSSLVTVCLEGQVYLWNSRGAAPRELGSNLALHATFSPDGEWVTTAGRDRVARLFEARTGREALVLSEHKSLISCTAFSPDGRRLITASADGTSRIYDSRTGDPLAVLPGHEGSVELAGFAADGRQVFTVSSDRRVRLWRLEAGRIRRILPLGSEPKAAAVRPDGLRIASAVLDGAVQLSDGQDGRPLATLGSPEGSSATHLLFSPDGHHLATASVDGRLRVLDTTTGQEKFQFTVAGALLYIAFRPQGDELALASSDGIVYLVSLPQRGIRQQITASDDIVYWVAYSPDGSRLASGGKGNAVKIWRAADGKLLRELTGGGDLVTHAAFRPHSTDLAVISGSVLQIWDSETGQSRPALRSGGGALELVQYSPDGSRILAADFDGDLQIWETSQGRLLSTLPATNKRFLAVSFSSDGQQIFSVSSDGLARRFEVAATTQTPVAMAAQVSCRQSAPRRAPRNAGPPAPACPPTDDSATPPALLRTPYGDRLDGLSAGIWALRSQRRETARAHFSRVRSDLTEYRDGLGLSMLTLAEALLLGEANRREAAWAQIPTLIAGGGASPTSQVTSYQALAEFAERTLDRADAARFCYEQLRRLQPSDPRFRLELQAHRVISGQFAQALEDGESAFQELAPHPGLRDARKVFLWALLWTAAVFQSDDAAGALWAGRLLSAYGQLPDGALDIADLPDQLRRLLANDTSELVGIAARRRVLDLWEIMKDKKTFNRVQDLIDLLNTK